MWRILIYYKLSYKKIHKNFWFLKFELKTNKKTLHFFFMQWVQWNILIWNVCHHSFENFQSCPIRHRVTIFLVERWTQFFLWVSGLTTQPQCLRPLLGSWVCTTYYLWTAGCYYVPGGCVATGPWAPFLSLTPHWTQGTAALFCFGLRSSSCADAASRLPSQLLCLTLDIARFSRLRLHSWVSS